LSEEAADDTDDNADKAQYEGNDRHFASLPVVLAE
jgi:hypothetical protein